jgi:hypothetical protein
LGSDGITFLVKKLGSQGSVQCDMVVLEVKDLMDNSQDGTEFIVDNVAKTNGFATDTLF